MDKRILTVWSSNSKRQSKSSNMKSLAAFMFLCGMSCAVAQDHQCQTHGELRPNPADSTSFYQCSYGHMFLLNCPEGLTFHHVLQRCEYPEMDDASNAVDRQGRLARTSFQCPSKELEHLPDTRNCGAFYKCEFGVAKWYHCPEGALFNADTRVCDLAERVNCLCSRK